MIRLLLLTLCISYISGCAWFGSDKGKYGPTLANLEDPVIEIDPEPVPLVPLAEIEEAYRQALEVAQQPTIRHRILIRLADLEMIQSEKRQIDSEAIDIFFAEAIQMYEELIVLNTQRQGEPDTPTNERLLYQLSKAYALDGQVEKSNEVLAQLVNQYPESAYAAEADFRRAEQAFSDGEYKKAQLLYAQVMEKGRDTPFYANAVYMHGWSLFKRSRYEPSIDSFTEVLEITVAPGQDVEKLSAGKRNLVQDTLRIMSIVFSYLDGANTIDQMYAGQTNYLHLLYRGLGDLYLDQERYRDSADTYRRFVQKYPNTDQSPAFSVKAIEVYKKGNFPSLIIPAKEEYVASYGIKSAFWADRTDEQRGEFKPNLKLFIDELSSFYHAEGQELKKANEEYEALAAKGKRPKEKPQPANKSYLKAARLYDEYTLTFPEDPKTPEMTYLMGEAFYESGYLPDSVAAYEKVAYSQLDKKYGPEAGYGAIVVLQELIDSTKDPEQKKQWSDRKNDSAINFATFYADDPRALTALTAAAQELFQDGQIERAEAEARRIVAWQPAPPKELKKTALFIIAHSQFDQNKFAESEITYTQILPLTDPKSEEHKQVKDRIAASVYKQAEQQLASDDKAGAVEKLLTLGNVAPGSEIATTAQYDAGNYLMELKQWGRAEAVFKNFKAQNPNHELTKSLNPKFAVIYQESEQWDKAAGALSAMASSDASPDVRRQSLYMSAELHERSGDHQKAIEQYKNYANKYPQPFALATEARYHLVELYGKTGQKANRDFWLRKLIDSNKKAGKNRTERSQYLAAYAAAKFADDDFARFRSVRFTLPLKKSIKVKKASMDKALRAYKGVIDYGVAEFATQSNHRIGEIYMQFSKDLLNAPRPKGLDELALEEYELLLEEQAYPFEEKAVDLLKANAERSWDGLYDKWIKQSFDSLAKVLPARYGKKEKVLEFSNALY